MIIIGIDEDLCVFVVTYVDTNKLTNNNFCSTTFIVLDKWKTLCVTFIIHITKV